VALVISAAVNQIHLAGHANPGAWPARFWLSAR